MGRPRIPRVATLAECLTPEFIARFWANVQRGGADECWPWGVRVSGYANVKIVALGHSVQAHRIALYIVRPFPLDLKVLHSCDNPPCCNPAHLRPGTDADNNRDKVERNRHYKRPPRSAYRCSCGGGKARAALRCLVCEGVMLPSEKNWWVA